MPSRRGAPARALLEALPTRTSEPYAVPRVGWLAADSTPGLLLVRWTGGPATSVVARSALALDPEQVAKAVATRHPVVLLFEDGDASRPLVVGLIQSGTSPLEVLSWAKTPAAEVRIDGRRRLLEAEDELVLRCGEASITLRRNGRVVIRGAQVETRARGTNRIKGGSVKIN